MPWKANTEKELLHKISTFDAVVPSHIKAGKWTKDFIKKCLTVDVNRRIKPADLINHPLFKEESSESKP